MGKHSVVGSRKRVFNKTMAVALAAGVSFGGVQVVSSTQTDFGLGSAVANAAELPASVVTADVVSNESQESIKNISDSEKTEEGYAQFFQTHGADYTLNLDFNIPNDATPGDTYTVSWQGFTTPSVGETVDAKNDGGNTVGTVKVNASSATFTVSDEVQSHTNRTAEFDVPLKIDKLTKPGRNNVNDSSLPSGWNSYTYGVTNVGEFDVYVNNIFNGDPTAKFSDIPVLVSKDGASIKDGNFVSKFNTKIGFHDVFKSGDGYSIPDGITGKTRDVVVKYTVDDDSSKIYTNDNYGKYLYEYTGKRYNTDEDPNAVESETGNFLYRAYGGDVDVQTSGEGTREVTVTIKDLPSNVAFDMQGFLLVETPYVEGKKIKVTGDFVNGVGEPTTAYDEKYESPTTETVSLYNADGTGQSVLNNPKYDVTYINPGKSMPSEQLSELNGADEFSIDTTKLPEGWSAEVDKTTGTVTATAPIGVKDGTKVSIPVTIKYSDGSTGTTNADFVVRITDTYVDDIAKQDNGDYLVTRNDGEEWTIPVGELADRIEDLENKPTVSPEDLDDIKKDLDKAKDDIKDLKAGDDDLQDEIDKINDDLDKLTPRVDDLEDRVTDLENNGIKEVRDNGDGTYTIIRNDGSEVDGKIGDTQDIKEIIPNEDGTMTIIHKDGAESVVDLKQVEITEQNEGTPNHMVTITSPNGDTVTFNVFDKYVTNVVKNESGDYDIFRSDVDGGETVWKTIVLSDIRDKISTLEDRADKLNEKDADLQRQIDKLKDSLGNTEKEIESLKDRTSGLEKAVAKINTRLSVIELNITALEGRMDALEGRVDTAETTQHAWAQCFSGILGTAIPLLAAVPFVAGSNIEIPGAAQWNNQIQRTLGIYNEKLNRMAGQYSGVIKAAATILGVAGTIGLGVHTAKACGPYSKTDAMSETKAGQLSSKLNNKSTGSSREK